MSPLPPPERRCRKLAKHAGLGLERRGPGPGLMAEPPVRVLRQGQVLAEPRGWEAVEDWLIEHTTG